MKKCLHLKKTKPHWKRKQPKHISRRERLELERKASLKRYQSHVSNPTQLFAALMREEPRTPGDIDVLMEILGDRRRQSSR